MIRLTPLLLAILFFAVSPASAQDAEENPYLDELNTKVEALSEGLDDDQRQQLAVIRARHGVIRAVRVVRGDVGSAIEACGQANPDLEPKLEGRYAGWTGTIDPILSEADRSMENAYRNQTVTSEKEMRGLIKLTEQAFEQRDSRIQKVPVTSYEACEGLLVNMDKTEEDLVRLMKDMFGQS